MSTVTVPRWEVYGSGSEVDYFAWWCAQNIVQVTEPFVGMPLVLEPWQLEFMGEALAVGEDGLQLWNSVALVVSRKNGKTALLAAYALYHLLTFDGNPEVLLAAASDRNARRLFDAAVAYVRANPILEQQVHIREYAGEIARRDGRGKLFRLANDPTTLHGYNPSLVVCDELHAWTKPSHRKVWSALTTAGGARTQKQVFTITTAGEASERATSILGRMLDANEESGELEHEDGLTISRNREGAALIYNYSAPTEDHHDTVALKLANPASWITAAGYLARQAASPDLTAAEVLQFHGCVWAVGERTWIDPALFSRLADPRGIQPDGVRCVLAFDGSKSRDSTVLIGATVEESPYLWVEGAWEKPPNAKEWRVPRRSVLAAIDDAIERYDVREFAPDPPGWEVEIEDLEEKYGEAGDGGLVLRFNTDQPRRMGPASDSFHQAILGPGEPEHLADLDSDEDEDEDEVDLYAPGLTHDGNEILTRHLSHCVPVQRAGFTVPTKESNDSPKKIDAAIGMIIAYSRARYLWTQEEDDIGAALVDIPQPGRGTTDRTRTTPGRKPGVTIHEAQ